LFFYLDAILTFSETDLCHLTTRDTRPGFTTSKKLLQHWRNNFQIKHLWYAPQKTWKWWDQLLSKIHG